MVKIKQGSIAGRIGTGLGQGLAEQLPKEMENQRLKSGLKSLADQSDQGNLSQAQFLAQAAGTYGISPQMVQSFGELAKTMNQANAYKKASGGNPYSGQQKGGEKGNPFSENQELMNAPQSGAQQTRNFQPFNQPHQLQKLQQQSQQMQQNGQVDNLQRSPNVNPNQDIPQVIEGNELNKQNLARQPWSPQQRNQSISDYIEQGFLPDQAKQLQADDEARDLAQPGVHKERLKEIEEAKGKVRAALKRHLETKLQKTEGDVFKDVEGKMIINAERGMNRDLILNPKADIDTVANDWSERLYHTAIAKGKLKTLGQTTGIESFFKGDTNLKKLKEYQDIFKRSGNLEEFKNILQGDDIGMSASGAASVAYPINSNINKFVSNYRPTVMSSQKGQEARKAALEIEKNIGPDDSVLSIVRKLADKDPFFDQQSFLDQISEDKDQLGLNERQRLELAEGASNIFPNWADLKYLPILRK